MQWTRLAQIQGLHISIESHFHSVHFRSWTKFLLRDFLVRLTFKNILPKNSDQQPDKSVNLFICQRSRVPIRYQITLSRTVMTKYLYLTSWFYWSLNKNEYVKNVDALSTSLKLLDLIAKLYNCCRGPWETLFEFVLEKIFSRHSKSKNIYYGP